MITDVFLPLGATAVLFLWIWASQKQSRAKSERFFAQFPELRPGYGSPVDRAGTDEKGRN